MLRNLACFLLASACLICALPAAQAAEASALRYMNREIVEFRAPLLGASAEQRARRALANLRENLEQPEPARFNVESNTLGNSILLNKQLLFTLTPADVEPLSGDSLDALTQRTLARLQAVARETEEGRNLQGLLLSLGWVVGETLLLAGLIWALRRGHRWTRRRLLARAARQSTSLPLTVISPRSVLTGLSRLLALCFWLLVVILLYGWLTAALAHFPYTRAWGEQLGGFLLSTLFSIGHGILRTIPNLLVAGTMFVLAWGAVRLLRPFFDRIEQGQLQLGWLDEETVRPTRRLSTALIWVFTLVMAYPYLPGSHSEAFKGMSVLLGLMISIGASSTVGQAVSGLILMYSRTLRRGEYVRIGEHEGTIVDIGMFNTRLRTGRGAEITLPNAMIVGSSTANYSRTVKDKGYVLDTTVTIGYDTPWRQVEAMLIEAASRTPGVLAEPRPAVFQTALSDFYPEYCLVCQAVPSAPRPRAQVLSELHANIQDVFNEYGVQIMSPHYRGDPEQEKLVPPGNWYAPPAKPPGA